MKLKTYQAWTMGEALDFVKSDLGADAVILHTRTFERGGFFGLGRRTVVEITAARAQDIPARAARAEPKRESQQAAAPTAAKSGTEALRASAAARAYAGPSRPVADKQPAGASEAPAVVNMDIERERTRRWAQAMAIALERSGVERASAGVNEHAVRAAAAQKPAAEPGGSRVSDCQASDCQASDCLASDGPARRFALVADATRPQGATRLTAALVQAGSDSAPAASISPTHSSLEVAKPIVEMKPDSLRTGVRTVEVAGSSDVSAHAPAHTPGDELHRISDFIGKVLKRAADPAGDAPVQSVSPAAVAVTRPPVLTPARSPAFDALQVELVEQDLDPEFAARIIADAARQLEPAALPSAEIARAAVLERLVAAMPADKADPFEMLPGRHGPRRIAFVGPTGVGKTTTLAKIAAQLKLKRGLRVGIVAADTYRIAAVDQLRTYAEILGLPVEVASSPRDAARACESLSEVDVVLIDTAGRSQNDHMKLSELKAFLASADPDETHLVLSATAGPRALAREAEAFGVAGIDRIVVTKLDEAATFGALVGLVARLGKGVSFLTHGQEVPDHIEFGRSRRLASLVLGSEVR